MSPRGVARVALAALLFCALPPAEAHPRESALLLARSGVQVLFPAAAGATHLKALAIDDRLVFLGSHNLTQGALSRNHELTLLVTDPALAREVRSYLERLAARSSSLAVRREDDSRPAPLPFRGAVRKNF